jgi:membrane protease YdiL (CAAX protease family)
MSSLMRRWPAASYAIALLAVSWIVFAVVVGPTLLRGGAMRPTHAFVMFPLLVASVAACGLVWANTTEPGGGKIIWRRTRKWRVALRWYALALALPPAAILATLGLLGALSPAFHHGFFVWGVLFGLVPGVLEEIGWMGYLFPRWLPHRGTAVRALTLGVFWACWHLPVVNFLGAAGPHGRYFIPFFLAFAGVLVAMRVVMVFVYTRTESVLLMQLMHASSTGSLVLLGPPHVSSRDEALWYAAYAAVLWILIAATALFRCQFSRSPDATASDSRPNNQATVSPRGNASSIR